MNWEKVAEIVGLLASGSLITAIFGFVLKFRRQTWEQRQESKRQIWERNQESKKLDQEQEETANALIEYKVLFDEVKRQLGTVSLEMMDIRNEHAKCREELVEFRGAVKLLEFKLNQSSPAKENP